MTSKATEARDDKKNSRDGRLTLHLSKELDQAVDAVKEMPRRPSSTDISEITLEGAFERVERTLELFSELSDQVSRAAAKHPQEAKRIRDMLKAVEELTLESGDPSLDPTVQTFQSLCRDINTIEGNGDALRRTIDHYSREFERAISGQLTWSLQELDVNGNGTGDWPLTRREAEEQRSTQVKLRTQEITNPEFIKRVVLPYAFSRRLRTPSLNCEATIVQETNTGRTTVRYDFGHETITFGKLYSSESQAEHSFQVQSDLWDSGFDGRGSYQVPEPLAYVPRYKLELIRAVKGRQLSALFDEQDPEFPTYARQAARWLVNLHLSPVRVGKGESLWQSMWFCKTLRRLAKASAALPDLREDMVELVDRLCDLGKRSFKLLPQVQAHGTFHYQHILVHGTTTGVIDFDRSFPSDPAKDLAEFLNVLRCRSFQLTKSVRLAEQPTTAFLEEYLHYLPENSSNLALHWGAAVLRTFFRQVRHHRQDDSYDEKIRFLRDEFESIVSGEMLTEVGRSSGGLRE